MLRKYTLIAVAFISFGFPLQAQAQTMDIVMKIQSILGQISEIRSMLKQVQSGMSIEQMAQNMFGEGKWKDALKNLAGGIFDKNAQKGGAKQAFLPLPDELAGNADDPEAMVSAMEKYFYVESDEPTNEEKDEAARKQVEFKYTVLLSGFSKAIALRKELDKTLETIEELKQDAQNTEAELDLQQEINKLSMLKLEQTQLQQLISATKERIAGAYKMTPVDQHTSKKLRGG